MVRMALLGIASALLLPISLPAQSEPTSVPSPWPTREERSWDQTQQKILVIGGMMGLWHQWEKIEWRWQELLDKYKIAPITGRPKRRAHQGVAREMSIDENYGRNITPIRSDISRFSRDAVSQPSFLQGGGSQ